MRARPRLLYVVSHAMTARHLLRGQLAWMQAQGWEVGLAASPGNDLDVVAEREGVQVFPVEIPREIDVAADLDAVRRLRRLMKDWKPDVVNAGTPKAGFLGMLAASSLRVPARIYTLRGLRMETTSGLTRAILRTTEGLSAACAHEVVAVSPSLAVRYVALGLALEPHVRVIGEGSSNGVKAERFEAPDATEVAGLRVRLGLPGDAPVVGFVGRFTRDKGIVELLEAFDLVFERIPEARLLLVGDFEKGDPVPDSAVTGLREHPRVTQAGFVADTAPYYQLMDVLAFPSHREGFPNVPLEAAAAGLPVAGFRATGTVDAVVEGRTGTLVEVGDAGGLAEALIAYLSDSDLRERHGRNGCERAKKAFAPERIWQGLHETYERLLRNAVKRHGGPGALGST